MKKNVGSFDGMTRLIGGAPLTIAAILTLPSIDARTLSTALLWIALVTGIVAIILSFAGRCAWYAGILITLSSYGLFVAQWSPSLPGRFMAITAAICIGLGALFTRALRTCPVNATFHLTSP